MHAHLDRREVLGLLASGNGELFLGSLLHLSSAQAFRCGACCQAFRSLFKRNGGNGALYYWQQLLSGVPKGLHSRGNIWMHALLPEAQVALYAGRTQHLDVVGELSFGSSAEVSAFGAAVDSLRAQDCSSAAFGRGCGSIFAGCWSFNPTEAGDLNAGRWRSCPVSFCSVEGGYFVFDVRLVLVAEDQGFSLHWDYSFPGEFLLEATDYIDVDLFGSVLVPGGNPPLELGGSDNSSHVDSALFQAMISGTPLVCLLRIVFRSMGMEQPVTLASPSKVFDSSSPCSPRPPRQLRTSTVPMPYANLHESLIEGDVNFDSAEFDNLLSTVHGTYYPHVDAHQRGGGGHGNVVDAESRFADDEFESLLSTVHVMSG